MADIEKVTRGIEACLNDNSCTRCPYYKHDNSYFCGVTDLMHDALELFLKAKSKPVKIVAVRAELDYGSWHYECPVCNGYVDAHDKFCRHCGVTLEV